MPGFTPKHDHALNGRTESRLDQEQGGGAGLSLRVGQSFAGPGEIKRRDE